MDIRRGEIYLVDFGQTVGSEIRKTRPAVIIQNDVGNRYSPLTIVAPVTSRKLGQKKYPTEVWIDANESGLDRDSKVLLNQIRTVDRARVSRRLGALSPDKMREVDEAIRISLGIQ